MRWSQGARPPSPWWRGLGVAGSEAGFLQRLLNCPGSLGCSGLQSIGFLRLLLPWEWGWGGGGDIRDNFERDLGKSGNSCGAFWRLRPA
jgi:hypothetical protein